MSVSRNQCSWIDDSWVHGEHNEILIIVNVDVLDNGDNFSDYCVIACNFSVKNVGALYVGYDRDELYLTFGHLMLTKILL